MSEFFFYQCIEKWKLRGLARPLNVIQSSYNFARFTSVPKRNFPWSGQLHLRTFWGDTLLGGQMLSSFRQHQAPYAIHYSKTPKSVLCITNHPRDSRCITWKVARLPGLVKKSPGQHGIEQAGNSHWSRDIVHGSVGEAMGSQHVEGIYRASHRYMHSSTRLSLIVTSMIVIETNCYTLLIVDR